MSANIFGERFYSFRQPAWHGLSNVSEEPLLAVDAFSKAGVYRVRLEDLETPSGLSVPSRAVVRGPIPGDPEPRVLDVVGPEYELMEPLETCMIYDEVIGKPVETLGALSEGRLLFLSTFLKRSQVITDDVDSYLLITSPVTGQKAGILITEVRVVCQNTLVAAQSNTSLRYDVVHRAGVKDIFREWLGIAYNIAAVRDEELLRLFGFFAKQKIDPNQREYVLDEAYPLPNRPKENAPAHIMERRLASYEQNSEWQVTQRSLADQLFLGAGVGQETEAAAGTAWGLWNAVVELEDYRGSHLPNNDYSRARDAIFGWRVAPKTLAFSALCDLYSINPE